MLSSRCLLRNVYIFERLPSSCKCTNNGKPNVIKNLNSENKYLYGSLVETQKQRRKKVSKTEGGNSKTLTTVKAASIIKTNENDETKTTEITNKSPKPRKSKGSNSVIEGFRPQSSETKCDKDNLKNHQKKTETLVNPIDQVKPYLNLDDEVGVTDSTISSSTDFVFKSAIPINETNYPLENPDKNGLFCHESQVENILSYGFNDPVVKCYSKFPSVSKVMEETMSDKNKIILSKWRQNMIADLGLDGFYKYNAALKTRGQEFHTAVRNAVQGKSMEDCSEVTQNALKSLSWTLENISHPMALESILAHPTLGYKGIPDCVALFRNVPVVIDWKLSDKPKKDLKDTYEAPVQITAYIGALNHDPNYKWGVNHGLVAVAYTSGDPCDVFLLAPKHCQIYWRHWLMRLDKFKERSHLHLDHDIDEKALERI